MIGAHRNQLGELYMRRNETPLRRVNPGGEVRWVARYTGKDGRRRSAGTFEKKGPCRRPTDGCCAAHAIQGAYEAEHVGTARHMQHGTVGDYAKRWLSAHPRSERTNHAYDQRLRAALPLDLGDGPFGEMGWADVDRQHAVRLREALLVDQGRSAEGARSIIRAITAMWRDALDDGTTRTACPFLNLTIRSTDPRVQKPAREPVVLTWEEMHAIARAAGQYEPMVRVLSDCGLRIGEMLPLRRRDVKLGATCDERCQITGPHLHVRRKTWRGAVEEGTKTGARTAPLAPGVAALLGRVTPLDPDGLMFPAPGGGVWWAENWRREVWRVACARAGVDARPHDMRHSWVSRMRAAGVDVSDVAAAAGHSVLTASRVYTHALRESWDAMRGAVGA